MNHIISFFKDIRFLAPFLFLLAFEAFMQTGLYRKALQPRSYAENVIRISDRIQASRVQPDGLILGTSVAYQGINLPLLNERLKGKLQFQSAASEGAKLETQHVLYSYLKPKLKNLRILLHVTEVTFAGTARYQLDWANRSMIAQFPNDLTLPLLNQQRFTLASSDYLFFYIRSYTYQRDIRDFALDPLDRIKGIGRRLREPYNDYPYENQNSFTMAAYQATTLQECIDHAKQGIPEKDGMGRIVTDRHHRDAVLKTCEVGLHDPMHSPGEEQWTELFFSRLSGLYKDAIRDNLILVNVYPPFSNLVQDKNSKDKALLWNARLDQILGKNKHYVLDLRNSLPAKTNQEYYYDTIHMNRAGSLLFTRILAEELASLYAKTNGFARQP